MLFPFPVIGRMAAILFIIFAPVFLFAQNKLPRDSATIFINESDTVYTKVDTVATYPGGTKRWARFLVNTLRYPQEALDNAITGETRISFIVNVDGKISDIKAVYGDPVLAAESVRILQLSGNWVPAMYKGQATKAYHIQPIIYRLR